MSYNGTAPINPPRRILVVRLGAMGDIIHALPAVARLKCSFPQARITWAVESQWSTLLNGNPDIDEVLPLPISVWRRRLGMVTWQEFQAVRTSLRASRFDLAVDFQGLLKSALVTFFSRADRVVGFERDELREPIAASFYSDRVPSEARHIVREKPGFGGRGRRERRADRVPHPGGQGRTRVAARRIRPHKSGCRLDLQAVAARALCRIGAPIVETQRNSTGRRLCSPQPSLRGGDLQSGPLPVRPCCTPPRSKA